MNKQRFIKQNLFSSRFVKKQFLFVPFLIVAAFFLLTAFLYQWKYDWFIAFSKQFYGSTDNFRYPYLAARVIGYHSFLWLGLGVLTLWCVILWLNSRVKRYETAISIRLSDNFQRIIETSVFLAMVIIALWFSHREWLRFNQPCWDNYCLYSDLILNWLQNPSFQTWSQLLSFLRWDYHSNSPFVPVLVAFTKFLTGMTVITSYRILCLVATLIGFLTIFLFLRFKLLASIGDTMVLILLLVSNMVVIRSAYFPQTDAFVFLWIALSITYSYEYLKKPSLSHSVKCFLIFTTGLFIKLSFLPALLLIPLWTALDSTGIGKGLSLGATLTIIRRSLIFIVSPLLIYFIFQVSLGLTTLYITEFHMMQTEDAFFPFHLISLLHAGAFFFLLIIIGARKLTKIDAFILGWAGLYILSLWLVKTSGWDRFYLSVIPPLAIASRHGLIILREELSTITLCLGILLYAILNYSALYLNLYQ